MNDNCTSVPCSLEELNIGNCSINNSLVNTQWLNNLVKFGSKFRYGNFAKNSKGDIFVEYSTGNKRLFYSLKSDGKFFFKDEENNETPIKYYTIINESKPDEIIRQYESKKIFVSLKTDTNNQKEYFLSLGSYTGYTELFDFENDFYSIISTEHLLGIQIYGFEYSLLDLNNTEKEYLCAYTSSSNFYSSGDNINIVKLSFPQNYLKGNEKLKDKLIQFNMPSRAISSFIKEQKMYLFYLNNEKKYLVNVYDSFLNMINNEEIIIYDGEMGDCFEGYGIFSKTILLRDDMTVFIYFTAREGKYPQLKVGELKYLYNNNVYHYYFNLKIFKLINEYEFHDDILKNDLIKIHKNRFSFISTSKDGSILYILLFDLYNNDQNLKTRIYQINVHKYYNLNIVYEFNVIMLNSNLVFSSSVYENSENNYFSILVIFGFANSTIDNIIDISPYFTDENIINKDNNFISKLKENIIIDNNIFGYIVADKIKLINIPEEIIFYNKDSNGNKIQLSNNDILNSDYMFSQNINKEKSNDYYSLDYQFVITEPNYDIFNEYAIKITDIRNDNNIDQKDEFEPVEFYSRTNQVKFKLCYKLCITCYYIGVSIDEQNCNTCSVNFDYKNEKSSDCIPEGYFKDKESGKIIKCDETNSKYYFDEETNKTLCFDNNYFCPEKYIYYSERECKKECSYSELVNNSCSISQENSIIYNELTQDLIKDYKNNEEILVLETEKDDYVFQVTNSMNEINTLDGIQNNEYNLSMIDLGQCEEKLREKYKINNDTPLIIIKFEKVTNVPSEKNIQYEIYNPFTLDKMDLSICENNTIDIYIPINLNNETLNLYSDLQEYGYDLFNENDSFYNNLCTPYKSKDNTDVLLSDRRKDFLNTSQTTCQEGCKYLSYLIETKYLKCECSVTNDNIITNSGMIKEKFEAKSVISTFYEVIKYSNIKILKCYKLLFSKNGQINNIGSIIVIIFIGINLSLLIGYIIKGIKPIYNSISNEIFNNKNKKKKKKQLPKIRKTIVKSKQKLVPPKKKVKRRSKCKSLIINKIKIVNNYKVKKGEHKTENSLLMSIKSPPINILSKRHKSFKVIKKKSSFDTRKDEFSLSTKKENEILSDFQLNNLDYIMAIKLDKRSLCKIFWSLLKRQHLILFTFFSFNDYNLSIIKFIRFIFLIVMDMAMNALFFFDDSMHKIYLNYGKYDFIQQIPQFLYSAIITNFVDLLLCYLSLTDTYFYEIKKRKNDKNIEKIIKNTIKCIKIKIIGFLSFTFIFMVAYWYIVGTFCAVYKHTQIIYLKDCLSSFLTSLLYPFILYLFPSILRIISLKYSKVNLKIVYKLSDIIPLF